MSSIEIFLGGYYPNNFDAGSPASKLLHNGEAKEQALVYMLDQQIAYQNKSSQAIINSNQKNAETIAQEINQQTKQLSSLKEELIQIEELSSERFDRLGELIETKFNEVNRELRKGNQLLSEIKWQLIQVNKNLSRIINLLENKRNTEARELVRQGVRLFIYNKVEISKERFLKAYELDKTDYQVLLNLGFVELRLNNVKNSISYFKDAVTLPSKLENVDTARALWALARSYYVDKNYEVAWKTAKKARQLFDTNNANYIFQEAVYASLAGHLNYAIQGLKQAILLNPNLFGEVACHKDLVNVQKEVYVLLNELLETAKSNINQRVIKINEFIDLTEKSKYKTEYNDVISSFQKLKKWASFILKKKSYIDKITFLSVTETILEWEKKLKKCDENYNKNVLLISESQKLTNEISKAKEKITVLQKTKNSHSRKMMTMKDNEDTFTWYQPIIFWSVWILYGILLILYCEYISYSEYDENNLFNSFKIQHIFNLIGMGAINPIFVIFIAKLSAIHKLVILIISYFVGYGISKYLGNREKLLKSLSLELKNKMTDIDDKIQSINEGIGNREILIERYSNGLRHNNININKIKQPLTIAVSSSSA